MTEIKFEPPEKVHPIGIRAYQVYTEGGRKFTAEGLATLQKAIDAMGDNLQEVLYALTALKAVGMHLEQQGDKAGGEAMDKLMLAQAPKFETLKQELTEKLQDTSQTARESFSKLSGNAPTQKTAPKIDAPPPQGSKKLSDFLPNPALRPPPVRKK